MFDPSTTVSFDAAGLKLETADDTQQICEAMRDKGDDLEVLILQGNSFGIEAAEAVGFQLSQHPNLKEAHFKDLFTTRGREQVPIALKHLLRGIEESGARLTLLDLSDNAIGPIGAPSVIEFLISASAENIEKLYVNNCGWGPEGSTSLSKVIAQLQNLKEFVCGRSRLEDKGATAISDALLSIKGLEVLKLNQNGISVTGIQEIARVLEANYQSIRELDLSDNTIKPGGSRFLQQPLSCAENLKILSLSDALLENEGFIIICDALQRNPFLDRLQLANFEGNELKGNKIIDLIESTFSVCTDTFTLDLLDNEFTAPQRLRLKSLRDKILVDSESEYDDSDEDGSDDGSYNQGGDDYSYLDRQDDRNAEVSRDSSENSDGYVDLAEGRFKDVIQDFIIVTQSKETDDSKIRTFFDEIISYGNGPHSQLTYNAVQIFCEELGLMKCESTRKKKPLAKDAVLYIGKNVSDLPKIFRDFFQCVTQNNDELSCGKTLFSI